MIQAIVHLEAQHKAILGPTPPHQSGSRTLPANGGVRTRERNGSDVSLRLAVAIDPEQQAVDEASAR